MAPPEDDVTRTKTEAPEEASIAEADPSAETALLGGGGARGVGAASPGGGRAAVSEDGDEDRSGEMLGRFRLSRKIGQGGMGVVYAAEDRKLGRTVALKILSREAVQREDRRRRFLREARAAAAVLHPSIATIFEVGEEGGEVFLAMEHVAGETLRKVMKDAAGPMPLARALAIARDIATGLGKAHGAGIVHRDLKPENVMITPEGHVKILDFGLAKRVSGAEAEAPPGTGDLATIEGQILGTVGYMAPEQALGEAVDPRTDLFSLGVILYEMAAGARPFVGETRMATLIATHRDPAAAPSSRNPGVPKDVDALVLRCLEKAKDARFQSAGELSEALEAALEAAKEAAKAPPERESKAQIGAESKAQIGAESKAQIGAESGAGGGRTRGSVIAVGLVGIALVAVGVRASRGWVFSGASGREGPSPAGTALGATAATTGTPAPEAGSPEPGTTGALGATTTGTVGADAGAPGAAPRRPCLAEDAGKKACSGTGKETAGEIAWCDPEGRPVGCCGKGLVPKGADGICVCAPGGSAVPEARSRGCGAVAADHDELYSKAKGEAMTRAIACFRPEDFRGAIAGGRFEAEFYLTPEGEVFGARVHRTTTPDDKGQACAMAALRSIRFPPPPWEEAGKKQGFGFVFKD